jgi:hypothetical protein
MFLLADLATYDCPICNPENAYCKSTIQFSSQPFDRPLYFLVFDIAISPAKLHSILSAFSDLADQQQYIVVLFAANSFILASVVNSVLHFDFVSNPKDLPIPSLLSMPVLTAVLRSFQSIFALVPEDLNDHVDALAAVDLCLKLADSRMAVIFSFFVRPLTDRSAAYVEPVSEAICKSQSIVHIGLSTSDFRVAVSICRSSLGCVFRFPTVSADLVRDLFSLSMPISYQIIAVRSLSVRAVTGAIGDALQESSFLSRLNLPRFVGGCVYFAVGTVESAVVRVVERVIASGRQFMTLHTLQHANGFRDAMQKPVADTLAFKLRAGRALGSVLSDADLVLPTDIYKLYFRLLACGTLETGARLSEIAGRWTLIDFPFIAILADDPKVEPPHGGWNVPIELRVIADRDEFRAVVEAAKLEVPESLRA